MTIQYPKSYLVFDTETTGLDPRDSRIVEIAALQVVEGKEPVSFQKLIKWSQPIGPKCTEITSITQAEVDEKGEDPNEVFKQFYELMAPQGMRPLPLVGHNIIKFDIPFLLATGMFSSWDGFMIDKYIWNRSVDTAALFKARKLNNSWMWYEDFMHYAVRALDQRVMGLKFNVGVCCDELGISREGIQQHRALADVMLTNEIYKKLCLEKSLVPSVQ